METLRHGRGRVWERAWPGKEASREKGGRDLVPAEDFWVPTRTFGIWLHGDYTGFTEAIGGNPTCGPFMNTKSRFEWRT